MSRRGLFKLSGAAAAGLALSGCAIPGLAKIVTPDEAKAQAQAFWPRQKQTGRLNFANWASWSMFPATKALGRCGPAKFCATPAPAKLQLCTSE